MGANLSASAAKTSEGRFQLPCWRGRADLQRPVPASPLWTHTPLPRATPPSSSDRIYCKTLGQGAVHASFAGYTGFSVSMLKTHFVILPTHCLNKVRAKRGRVCLHVCLHVLVCVCVFLGGVFALKDARNLCHHRGHFQLHADSAKLLFPLLAQALTCLNPALLCPAGRALRQHKGPHLDAPQALHPAARLLVTALARAEHRLAS